MPDASLPTPSSRQLPSPGLPDGPSPNGQEPATASDSPFAERAPRRPRVGELAMAWRIALTSTWALAFLAYLGVWKASVEIGIGTWWLGARSDPQPVIVKLVPFVVIATFGALASLPLRRLPLISLSGSAVLAVIALPDFSRAAGLAVIELAIAGAVAVVSIASLTGRFRAPGAQTAG